MRARLDSDWPCDEFSFTCLCRKRKTLPMFCVETLDGNVRVRDPLSEYLASLVVTKLSAIKRQMISDGGIRMKEQHVVGGAPQSLKELEESTARGSVGRWKTGSIWST